MKRQPINLQIIVYVEWYSVIIHLRRFTIVWRKIRLRNCTIGIAWWSLKIQGGTECTLKWIQPGWRFPIWFVLPIEKEVRTPAFRMPRSPVDAPTAVNWRQALTFSHQTTTKKYTIPFRKSPSDTLFISFPTIPLKRRLRFGIWSPTLKQNIMRRTCILSKIHRTFTDPAYRTTKGGRRWHLSNWCSMPYLPTVIQKIHEMMPEEDSECTKMQTQIQSKK